MLKDQSNGVSRNPWPAVGTRRAGTHSIPAEASFAERPLAMPAEATATRPQYSGESVPQVLAQDGVHECEYPSLRIPPTRREPAACRVAPDPTNKAGTCRLSESMSRRLRS